MTHEEIEKRVKLVLQAKEVLHQPQEHGLIRPSYKAVLASAMDTAMRLAQSNTTGSSQWQPLPPGHSSANAA